MPDSITSGSGAIWGGSRCSLRSTTGTIGGSSAIWGGDGRYRR